MMGIEQEDSDKAEKWVQHYSSNHQILLVGDGDFSFSLCLARSFCSASNLVVTSLDPYDVVIKKYKDAKSNLESLQKLGLGPSFVDGVDATRMKLHAKMKGRKFDRIIFNFPHAGFLGKEDDAIVIHQHRSLVHGFFWNARCMLQRNGEIHINHKTTVPFCDWNLKELASWNSLLLIDCVDFKIEDFPGYNHKRGDGPRCDQPFPLGPCSTFKFCLSPTSSNNLSTSFDFYRPQAGHFTMLSYIANQPLQRLSSLESCGCPQFERISRTSPNFEHVQFPLIGSGVRNWEEEFGCFPLPCTEFRKRAHHDVAYPSSHEMRLGFNTNQPFQRLISLESSGYPQLERISGTSPNFEFVGFPLKDPAVRNWEEEFGCYPPPFDRNTEIQKRARLDVASAPSHEMRLGFNIDMTLNHGNGTHLSHELGRITCHDVGFHADEYKYGGSNKNMGIMNPERTSYQDMHILPQCNKRTRRDEDYFVNEWRLGFDRDIASMRLQRMVDPKLDRTEALCLVRKYGNQEQTFRHSGYIDR